MPQTFRTQPVGQYVPAFYQVSIRSPGSLAAMFATYTFPLSPGALRTDRSFLSNFVDVQDDSTNFQGVKRIVDTYGQAAPMFTIEGTTGWDRHMSDGYLLSGLQSIQLLQAFLSRYATLNQIQRRAGNPNLYSLEFYDYFQQQFWVVEPVGPQIVRQSADRPLLTFYRFRWIGVRLAGVPLLGEADALLQLFGTPSVVAAVNAASTIGAIVTTYGPTGLF